MKLTINYYDKKLKDNCSIFYLKLEDFNSYEDFLKGLKKVEINYNLINYVLIDGINVNFDDFFRKYYKLKVISVKVSFFKNFKDISFNFKSNFTLDEILLKLKEISEKKDFLENVKIYNEELRNIKEEEALEGNIKNFSLKVNYVNCFENLFENIKNVEIESEFFRTKLTINELILKYFKEDECSLIILP